MLSFETGTSAGQLDADYVGKVEKYLGFSFPQSYVALMRESNGGVPCKPIFKLGRTERLIERFLSFVPDYKTNKIGCYDVEVVWSQIDDRLNDYLCPFAELFAGDYLCFDVERRTEPRIVIWDHERSEVLAPFLIEVAPNFDDFLELLSSAPE